MCKLILIFILLGYWRWSSAMDKSYVIVVEKQRNCHEKRIRKLDWPDNSRYFRQ
jgi:hypothetical protein